MLIFKEKIIKIILLIIIVIKFSSNDLEKLISSRSFPDKPLLLTSINYILNYISSMDSNNGPLHVEIGEREGKILSQNVNNLNYGLVHGVGRSGSINDLQPKAIGLSLLLQLNV